MRLFYSGKWALSAGLALVLVGAGSALAQSPGEADLSQAYKALAVKDYDTAIDLFRKALAVQPANAAAHKDLAYTLLKAGENEDARDEFEKALCLNEHDETAALEFAFLAFETKEPIEARRMFDRLRESPNSATRATAEQAFQNIDRPLAEGIARWKDALARSANPNDISMYSAHWELAQLAELRDDLPLAAEQYEICRKLKPQQSELLIILARVWRQMNRVDDANAALLAASRSSDSRTAEEALEQLGTRYPYVYEFSNALKLDPGNTNLRRELAFLFLAMHKQDEALVEFQQVLSLDPNDRVARDQLDALHGFKKRPAAQTVASASLSGTDAKSMGLKSLKLGYLRDAIRYLRQAHEQSPDDGEVTLRLGWAYNESNDNADALECFAEARHASDPDVAAEATKAYHVLNGDVLPQTTVWALPMYSSRWGDLFGYGQVKRTMPLPFLGKANHFFSLYLSTRFDGDARGSVRTAFGPGYLSETSFISALGASSKIWHHLMVWGEAGEAFKYLPNVRDAAVPDYRGGLNFSKGFGHLLGTGTSGLFYETTGDAIYVSRFDKDWLFYSQHRTGRTFHFGEKTAAQLLVNANYARDMKGEYWANSLEVGPGARIHFGWMPRNVYFSTDVLHGFYLNGPYLDAANIPHLSYNDVRVGLWYAVTR